MVFFIFSPLLALLPFPQPVLSCGETNFTELHLWKSRKETNIWIPEKEENALALPVPVILTKTG